ncbi:MAG TPA: bacillithiol biosynthesis cysteine-adding enzyme BshC [Verrucomicrobiae bacterium]|nr:bacillithiol biosynthesis cysteine-adding enzyme BshC [Verrucomicrobiae bacterium]
MSLSMESQTLPLSQLPQTSKLFAAFLDHFPRVQSYYSHPPDLAGVRDSARKVSLDAGTRREVVEILRRQNARFDPSGLIDASVGRNLDRLAAGAVAIVTGQQVGLFSGPSYSVYKALSALRWADALTREGIEAVPVFWLATEDHDFAEVNHVFWNTRGGLARLEIPPREAEAGHRVGEIPLDGPVEELVAQAADTLEGAEAEWVGAALRGSYTPADTFGSAYGKLFARILAGRGIILLDPLDSGLHRLAAPVYRRAMEESESLRQGLLKRSKELENTGYHSQVKVTRETTLLFATVDGRRQPLRARNGNFAAGSRSFTREELLGDIESSPENFTPNVLLRPIVQDTLLPTAAYIGGPAEIAYMAQAQIVYEKILGRMPAMLPRAGFTLVEPSIGRLLKKYGLEVADVLLERRSVRSRMELTALPKGVARRFEKDEKALRRLLASYSKPLEGLDKTLVGARDTAERKIMHQFLKLKSRAARAQAFRSGVLDAHERTLLDSLLPNRGLQERSLCFLPFLAAYGPGVLDSLARLACPCESGGAASPVHHVVFL